MNETMEILQWLLGGGGLIAILSLPYTIKKIRSEAEGEIERRWKALNDEQQEEIRDLRDQVNDLRSQVNENQREIVDFREAIMTAYACKHDTNDCPVLRKYKEKKNNEQLNG